MSEEPLSELFACVGAWAVSKGATNLRDHAGCWEGVCDGFEIAINVHGTEQQTSKGMTVPPLHVFIEHPRYLGAVILVNPFGGIGAPGMEADVIAALKADTPSEVGVH